MQTQNPIIVFGYAFPHRKTWDFLSILASSGYTNLTVIAAPRLVLSGAASTKSNQTYDSAYDVQEICTLLGISYIEARHDDVDLIASVRAEVGAKLAIISGARILKAEVIQLFPNGVVNFHPGKIPQTSGLDSFYYTIEKDCEMGVTAHLIDARVDAGHFILFEKVRIAAEDCMESVREKVYAAQITALRRYLKKILHSGGDYLPINRPSKNEPLTDDARENINNLFDDWKYGQIKKQDALEDQFFKRCAFGEVDEVMALISDHNYLLHLKNERGWSALIIAAFEHMKSW